MSERGHKRARRMLLVTAALAAPAASGALPACSESAKVEREPAASASPTATVREVYAANPKGSFYDAGLALPIEDAGVATVGALDASLPRDPKTGARKADAGAVSTPKPKPTGTPLPGNPKGSHYVDPPLR